MPRQKHVYPTNEIPHLWAHQTQHDARNQQSNLYFEGDTIYSYGSHFPIARFVERKGKKVVLFTTSTYSTTTACHCSMVRSAIPSSVPVFHVPDLVPTNSDPKNHGENTERFRSEITRCLEKAARARKWRESFLKEAVYWRDEQALGYCKFFGLKAKFPNVPTLSSGDLDKLKLQLSKAAAQKSALHKKEQLEAIARWRNGGPIYGYSSGLPTMLRIAGEEIETSMGARFPISHAKLALRIVRKVMESGVEYRTNGHTIHLGNYTLDRITTDGTVYAGCHVVTWAEIKLIAPKLEG